MISTVLLQTRKELNYPWIPVTNKDTGEICVQAVKKRYQRKNVDTSKIKDLKNYIYFSGTTTQFDQSCKLIFVHDYITDPNTKVCLFITEKKIQILNIESDADNAHDM